jgi:hypothetical protein
MKFLNIFSFFHFLKFFIILIFFRFAWQNAYACDLLEAAGKCKSPLEKIKYTTAFALSKFHLSGTQLKPFNPILGETFQCKIRDSMFYMEQTCHHPPILNFYVKKVFLFT